MSVKDKRVRMPSKISGIAKTVRAAAQKVDAEKAASALAAVKAKRKYRSKKVLTQDFYLRLRAVEFETKSVIGLERVSSVAADGVVYPAGYNVFVNGSSYRVATLADCIAWLQGFSAGYALSSGCVLGAGAPKYACEKGAMMIGKENAENLAAS